MPARIVQIADALVDALNGAGFDPPLVATREYIPIYDLEDMTEQKLTVVAAATKGERLDRARWADEYVIHVAHQQKVDPTPAVVDALMLQVEAIKRYLRDTPLELDGPLIAKCMGVVNEPIYSPEHLDELRQFTSVLSCTYRLME